MSTLQERLRSQHHDLRQGAMYTLAEDPLWDATAQAADALDAAYEELFELRRPRGGNR